MLAESRIFVSASAIFMKRSSSSAGLTTYGWQGEYTASGAKRYRSVAYSAPKRIENTTLSPAQQMAVDKRANLKVKQYVARHADKRVTKRYTGLISSSSAGGIFQVQNFTRGDNPVNNVSGEKITPTRVEINWVWDNTSVTGSLYSNCRHIVVQAKGDMDPTIDYFYDLNGSFQAPLATKNWPNRKNFKVLYDSGAIPFSCQEGHPNANGLMINGHIVITKNLSPMYLAPVSTDDVRVSRNNIYVLHMTDSALEPHPVFYAECQIEFTDEM